MSIKLFKMFESRAYELTEEDFVDLLNKNCKDFIKAPKLLQRNKKQGPKFSSVNPKTNIRTSMLTSDGSAGVKSNHGTLLMDNLPSWSKFPKRSQSIIGLTTFDVSGLFGREKFFVIPFDGAKFGVCPARDLWGVKCTSFDESIITFDDNLSNMFVDLKITDNSYDEMMTGLQKSFDDWLEKSSEIDLKNKYSRTLVIFDKMKDLGYSDVRLAIDYFFNPKNFISNSGNEMKGFSVMRWIEKPYGGLVTSFDQAEGHEFWTDSECLLYRIDIKNNNSNLEEIRETIKEEFDNMIKKFIEKKY